MTTRGAGAESRVTTVVLAARGDARLARTLASVAWTADPIVLDPARRLAGRELPSGARSVAAAHLEGVTVRPWVLLLVEGEVVTPPLADAVETATRGGDAAAYRIPLEVHGQGGILRPRRAPLRLAPAVGVRIRLAPGLGPALGTSHRPAAILGVPLMAYRATSLGEMVTDLDAEGATLAALLHAARVRPSRLRATLAALAAAATLMTARRAARAPWARWGLAVSAGYRAIVTYAKVWELARADGTAA